jgi:hypothetical protein
MYQVYLVFCNLSESFLGSAHRELPLVGGNALSLLALNGEASRATW